MVLPSWDLGMRTVIFLSLRPGFPRRLWTGAEPHCATRELGRLIAGGPCARVISAGRLGTVPNVARASQRRRSYGCGYWVSTGDGGCAPMRALCCCLLRITFGVESANLNTWSAIFYGAKSSAISDVIFIAENGSWDSPTRRFLHIRVRFPLASRTRTAWKFSSATFSVGHI